MPAATEVRAASPSNLERNQNRGRSGFDEFRELGDVFFTDDADHGELDSLEPVVVRLVHDLDNRESAVLVTRDQHQIEQANEPRVEDLPERVDNAR